MSKFDLSKTVEENIEKFGWSVVTIFDPDGNDVDYAYTIGLNKTYGVPDLIIFGLDGKTSHHK
jgi:hypothetical protein